ATALSAASTSSRTHEGWRPATTKPQLVIWASSISPPSGFGCAHLSTRPSSVPQEITFRPVEEQDFPILAAWLAEPHVRRFYQKTPVTLEEIAREYGPCVRGEEPSICHLAINAGTPFAYLQCYRNADYPEWMNMIGVEGGISVDLYIGESRYLRKGFGRAALSLYLQRVAFPYFSGETRAYIAHDV